MRLPLSSVTRSLELIGNTPVVRLQHVVPSHCAQIFLKIESTNPTGSYKDRMAKSMIEEAERRGDLNPGTAIVEATGGSTGSSLAFVCALRTMATFGANLDLIHSPSGKITPTLISSMIRRAEEFKNRDALVGYETIGHELVQQVPEIDAFCGAVGTAGMVMGVARVLKAKRPETLISVLEPASSPTITQGRPGTHHVEGIGIGIIPPLFDRQLYDEALAISEDEGRSMCRRLAREEGLLVGTSTGLNVVAAIELARKLGSGKTVVTVAADTGLKYLKGDLFTDE
ncbi:pyridoxal phosphate-dependent enzyme, beta subunit [Aspergillus novoparasiticus]|uniref:Pyridoxal phosphate-dependent enzyme, beta subunit n=1 Tax=Aspergillus novoparasiticus TaxID=986946 RepID=A0A5N6EUY0_9EURO|nr:pyridoxal phosphate-dependent enzyme, beta subunit [Aspergillus novoparasiticus]